ncbi:DoxX family protein [Leifsonia flava]|uniref:DoxX family protein n=1 Tax=Orlajensenia leifsoniae TaxID=2561933 RepID=A0A4Y9R358_9MICO|nr:DoxX family protein [Leifsonia flava]TFV98133.1 DoxX family protein [Leifsonia flava]
MIIVLWIVTGLLALLFVAAGATKATRSRASLQPRMAYVEDFSDGQVKTIGILEVLGGIGLVLPMATGILPWLTPLAAFALFITMVAAFFVHLRRGEGRESAPVWVLAGLSLAVGIGWVVVLAN